MAHYVLAASLGEEKREEIIRDLYKKHSAELLAIEEAQQKLVLLVLGVLGAGASFLASDKGPPMGMAGKIGLTAVVIALLAIAAIYTDKRNQARVTVRTMLTRCEEALGLFDPGLYLNEPLYAPHYRLYPAVGGWLGWTFFFAVVAGIGFLIVLWAR